MKTRPKRTQDEAVAVICAKCGHKHSFASLEALEKTLKSTPCAGCGFLFLQYLASKIDAMHTLVESDSKAAALLRDGKIKDFENYLKKKTGL